MAYDARHEKAKSFPSACNMFMREPSQEKSQEKSIVLIGMMGAGKTALGRQLAARLNLPFFDSDAEIEAATGMKIAAIFKEQGEQAFREIEKNKIARLLAGPVCVLSTGGGAILDEATRALFAEKAVTLWLKARVETLLARVARDKNRPLLKTENPRARLEALLTARTPFYEKADIHIETDVKGFEDTMAELMKRLEARV